MPTRRIDYPRTSDIDSYGRNGHIRTTGCLVSSYEDSAQIEPISSRGEVARCRIGVAPDALGDLGTACIELYFERCSPAEREVLMDRLRLAAAAAPRGQDGADEETGEFNQGLAKP